jgi:hypothetical protein
MLLPLLRRGSNFLSPLEDGDPAPRYRFLLSIDAAISVAREKLRLSLIAPSGGLSLLN